jgi:hypothetical protein
MQDEHDGVRAIIPFDGDPLIDPADWHEHFFFDRRRRLRTVGKRESGQTYDRKGNDAAKHPPGLSRGVD